MNLLNDDVRKQREENTLRNREERKVSIFSGHRFSAIFYFLLILILYKVNFPQRELWWMIIFATQIIVPCGNDIDQ